MKESRAAAPATVANIACGFDVLGLALEGPVDTVTAKIATDSGVRITISGDGGFLPTQSERNTAAIAALAVLQLGSVECGVQLELEKGLPLASGLGSSTASAAAAAVAVNDLFGLELTQLQLIEAVIQAEEVACGSAHADNAAPAILGGVVLVRYDEPIDVIKLPVPQGMYVAIARPHFQLLTRDSRSVLPLEIPLVEAITQWSNLGGFIAALYREDWELLGRCLVDRVAEPRRAPLVPSFHSVKQAALDAGAVGASLSGSGPAIFAIACGRSACDQIVEEMRRAFLEGGLECDTVVSAVGVQGAHLLPI